MSNHTCAAAAVAALVVVVVVVVMMVVVVVVDSVPVFCGHCLRISTWGSKVTPKHIKMIKHRERGRGEGRGVHTVHRRNSLTKLKITDIKNRRKIFFYK